MQRNSGELGGPGCPLSSQSGQPAACPGQAHVCRAPADPPQERSLMAGRESVPEGKRWGAWGSADTCRSSTEESFCPGKPSEEGRFTAISNTFVYPSLSLISKKNPYDNTYEFLLLTMVTPKGFGPLNPALRGL